MSFVLSLEEGSYLVKIARKAIETYLETGKKLKTPADTPLKFREKYGVFVTLNKMIEGKEELRGCIGFPLPYFPLVEATIDAAISAATCDPRFSPLISQELKIIVLEVSVLTSPTLIEINDPRDYVKKVTVGRDGLIVERGGCTGLLLPQVPIEWHWDAEEFLCQCCLKAGLPPDSWLVRGTKISKFSSIIARELSPNGSIEIVDMRNE